MEESTLVGVVFAAAIIVAAIVVLVATIRSLIVIVPPNTAAIITGRTRLMEDGKRVGYRAVIGGRTVRIPIIEQVAWMPLSTIPIELSVQNAFSKGGIPLSVQAVGNVKLASEPETTFNNGVERLLGKRVAEIEVLAKETLSANLRGVLATLTPEEVNEDRMKFAAELLQEADQDLQKLGLQLDTLKIQNVSDEVGYLAAVGRVKTSQIIKAAQVAEAQNEAETRQRQAEARRVSEVTQAEMEAEVLQRQAEARRAAEVAQAQADVKIAEARNELRVRQANLDREAETTEKVAKVEAARAEVEAQQQLESQRVELQRRRLVADVVEPAEAARKAAEAHARAEAAPILENGKAQVEVLKLIYEQIAQGGDQGFAVFMAEKLPALLSTSVEAVKGIEIDRLVVLDGGEGGGVGTAANQRINAAFRTIEGLGSALGLDVQSLLQSAAQKAGAGSAVPAKAVSYPADPDKLR